MSFISEAELADMRKDSTSALPDRCYIYRKTMTSDGAGGVSEVWAATTLEPIPVELFTSGGAQEYEHVGAAIMQQIYWRAILPIGTDVKPTDRIVTDRVTIELISVTDSSYHIAVQASGVEIK